MALTVAIQMDPIDRIDISGDSTFALALEGQRRGHGLMYYGPRDLTFRENKITARVRPLHVRACTPPAHKHVAIARHALH